MNNVKYILAYDGSSLSLLHLFRVLSEADTHFAKYTAQ